MFLFTFFFFFKRIEWKFWLTVQGQYGSSLVYVSINDQKEEETVIALSKVDKICPASSILKAL